MPKRLTVGKYSRKQVAEALDLTIDKNFKRNCERKLDRLGYKDKYTYSTKEIEIFAETALSQDEMDLNELLIDFCKIDPQINSKAYAIFFFLLTQQTCFNSMPLEERVKHLKKKYNVEIGLSNLKEWIKKLTELGIIIIDKDEKTKWYSYYCSGELTRHRISEKDEEEMSFFNQYQQKKKEIYKQVRDWEETFKLLWDEYKCCYYECPTIKFGAWNNLQEEQYNSIIELCKKIYTDLQKEL